MSSSRSARPISIVLQRSRWLLSFTVVSHCLTLLALAIAPLPGMVLMVCAVMVVASLIHQLSIHGWLTKTTQWFFRCKRQVVSFVWQTNGQWVLTTADGQQRKADLLPTTVVFPWMVSLHFKLQDAPWYRSRVQVLLLPDNTDRDSFRRLRVRLRLEPLDVAGNSAE